MAVELKHRNSEGQFSALSLEERVKELESKVTTLENKTCLRPGVDITTNIDRWFRSHTVLATIQFVYELRALNPMYTESSIRTAIWRYSKNGHITRLRDGLYIENE